MNSTDNDEVYERILILDGSPKEDKRFHTMTIYSPVNKLGKLLRKLHYHIPIPWKSIWYNKWKYKVNNYDLVILQDGVYGVEIIDYIKKRNSKCRIIFYYTNPVELDSKSSPDKFKGKDCELWSFDQLDCQCYNMKYNQLFYNYEEKKLERNSEILYDAYFIGYEKGRLDILVSLQKTLENFQMKCRFHIVKSIRKKYSTNQDAYLTEEILPYNKVIKEICKSRCIIEILQDGQSGMTLRTLESLFYDKKLITNNHYIVNYKFYNKNNIFILGLDSWDDFGIFMSLPFQKVNNDILEYYSYENWIKRFYCIDE